MIVSRAPVRLSMGGGGTDLPSYYERFGGFLMSVTINKFVYLMLGKRFQDSIRLSYSKTEIVDKVDEIEHNIFREALRFVGVDKKIELVSYADVPAQCGLGTSSTFTVALLNALFVYKKDYVSLDELARTACRLEIEILGEPIGKQDQYSAAYGGFNAYTFEKDGSVHVEPVDVHEDRVLELQNNLFLFHLGKERSASEILSVQNKSVKEGDARASERLHTIKELGLRTRKVFESGRLDEFGEIMHEHWLTKKKLSDKISDPRIDEAYELARKSGAIGGKVVGAGGGGFLLVYCPSGRTKLVDAMRKLGLAPTWFAFENEGAKIVFNG
jgi:D-glycero-alpha-D-manno-heptose-7-phosphate kinase